MPGSVSVSVAILLSFLAALCRVAGVFVFVPLPGISAGPGVARVVISLAATFALYDRWPAVDPTSGIWTVAGLVLSEAAFGVTVGLAVTVIAESLLLGVQILSLQAGYAFASTFDPNSQADSGILLVIGQWFAGLAFFSLGFDRVVIRAIAESMSKHAAGTVVIAPSAAREMTRLFGAMFGTAVRIALPILAMLLVIDIAVSLLGRMSSHLQVATVSFPVKMTVAVVMLAWLAPLLIRVQEYIATPAFRFVNAIAAR